MRNWTQTQERYLQFELSSQLGEIAISLARINSQIHLDIPQEGILATIQECQNFIAWTIPGVNIAVQEHLRELEQLLSSWHHDLSTSYPNSLDRANLAEQSKDWSEKILNDSELLTQRGLPGSDQSGANVASPQISE
jgi:hypothetical protein